MYIHSTHHQSLCVCIMHPPEIIYYVLCILSPIHLLKLLKEKLNYLHPSIWLTEIQMG